jgi:phosphatidylserine/phosphatidylglycerophosphate/cardiolipin synthase-like enzyme
MKVKVHHNGDDALIAWKPEGFIAGCRGFALLRKRNGVEEVVSTWVGFVGDQYPVGERRASTNWPIQKYQWTDFMANSGDTLQYRVLPMIGPDKRNLRPDPTTASDWTPEVTLGKAAAAGIEPYFNRGIVASQWVSRRLGITGQDLGTAKLAKVITTPADPMRAFLAGPLGAALFKLLDDAISDGREVFAALYELDDPQLLDALKRLGPKAHLVLANGSVEHVGEDQNQDARAALRNVVDLHDRMISPRALGHNKFLVVCDAAGQPRWVWTGSQNWTSTGLCTQANNSVLIDDAALAAAYHQQWQLLRDAGNDTPATLKTSNTTPQDLDIQHTPVRLWFTPTVGQVDLNEARELIAGAKRAILFLMFNPGPADTLLNQIVETARAANPDGRLYIHGVVNQDPSTSAHPVGLFDGANTVNADYEVVLPAAIDTATQFFRRELLKLPKAHAMVHSKVVVIDPFDDHPVVLTGSHNLGPRASGFNDENLLIIRDAPGVADAYASNIMAVYTQYRWRFRRHVQPPAERWQGLEDCDGWQTGYLKPDSAALREIDFWTGS